MALAVVCATLHLADVNSFHFDANTAQVHAQSPHVKPHPCSSLISQVCTAIMWAAAFLRRVRHVAGNRWRYDGLRVVCALWCVGIVYVNTYCVYVCVCVCQCCTSRPSIRRMYEMARPFRKMSTEYVLRGHRRPTTTDQVNLFIVSWFIPQRIIRFIMGFVVLRFPVYENKRTLRANDMNLLCSKISKFMHIQSGSVIWTCIRTILHERSNSRQPS